MMTLIIINTMYIYIYIITVNWNNNLCIDHVLATELEFNNDNQFTGKLDGVYCVGEGKIHHMKRFLRKQLKG